MDDRTLEALKASIRHWEENVAAETPDAASVSATRCSLCTAFPDEGCTGCPVRERTGQSECVDTPYYDAQPALWDWRHNQGSRERFRTAAQAELDFLKSLLPEGK
jgi:hypothetical protein